MVTSTDYTNNFLIAKTIFVDSTQNIGKKLNSFIWPYMRIAAFRKDSFADTKAMIQDANVQYYMIFEPNTLYVDYPITRLKWTLPKQFGIPEVRELGECSIQLKNIPDCQLYRNITRFIEMNPYVNNAGYEYKHAISIVELGDQDTPFRAPLYPGDFYEMVVECWSNSTLVEKATVRLSNVQGFDLEQSKMGIRNQLDENILGLHQF